MNLFNPPGQETPSALNSSGSASAPHLSLVIPAYNEAGRLPASLGVLRERLAAGNLLDRTEILVVDDGSADGTRAAAEAAGARLALHLRVIALPENRGKGHAVRVGVLASRGDWVLISDADFSTPFDEWTKLASTGADVAIGSRGLDESLVKTPQPLFRRASGKLFNKLVQIVVLPGIRDTQCGFKLFRREAAHAVFALATEDRFAFDVEALVLARRLGYSIAEVPVLWFNSEDSRVGFLSGAKAFIDLGRIRFKTRNAGKG